MKPVSAVTSETSCRATGQVARWWPRGGFFIIGGADGLAPEIRKRADLTLAFGKVTWPHQLVRIMLLEQLYRAVTILSGHPYHPGVTVTSIHSFVRSLADAGKAEESPQCRRSVLKHCPAHSLQIGTHLFEHELYAVPSHQMLLPLRSLAALAAEAAIEAVSVQSAAAEPRSRGCRQHQEPRSGTRSRARRAAPRRRNDPQARTGNRSRLVRIAASSISR